MAHDKDTTDFSKNVQPTVTTSILDEPDHSKFEGRHQNQESSDKECEDSDKDLLVSDKPDKGKLDAELEDNCKIIRKPFQNQNFDTSEISIARSDAATVGSNESEIHQQEFQLSDDDNEGDSADDAKSSSSSSSLMDSALPEYKQTVEHALEDSHEKMDSQIDTTYGKLIHNVETLKENVDKVNPDFENDSNISEDSIEHQPERAYSESEVKSLPEEVKRDADKIKSDDFDLDSNGNQKYFDNSGKRKILEENDQQIVQSQEGIKETLTEKMGDYMNNLNNVVHNFHDLNTTFSSLEQEYDETNESMLTNIDRQGDQTEDAKSKMEFLSNLMREIKKMTHEMQMNVKDLHEITAKVPSVETLFISMKEKFRKNDDRIKVKFDEQNERLHGEMQNVLSKYDELERRLNFIEESTKKSIESDYLNRNIQELDSDILKIQVKSEEFERKTDELETSLRDELEELGRKVNSMNIDAHKKINDVKEEINKSDCIMTLLEETKAELQNYFQKEISESEKDILKRLDEDRTKKLALMIGAVEEEAAKIHNKLGKVDSYYEALRKEFRERDAEIVKRLEEDSVTSDQIIRDKIKEAIELYSKEYDAKVTQRIHEVIESYEERVNKLADDSFASFNEEIQKTTEQRIYAVEEENRKLKEHKRGLKKKLEVKEAENIEFKHECDRNDVIITKLGEDKTELENKVYYLKNERKQLETQIKEIEDQTHEMERAYKVKLAENDEEVNTMKISVDRLSQRVRSVEVDKVWYKRWLNVSLAIVTVLLIAIVCLFTSFFDNNLYLVASLGPAPQ